MKILVDLFQIIILISGALIRVKGQNRAFILKKINIIDKRF